MNARVALGAVCWLLAAAGGTLAAAPAPERLLATAEALTAPAFAGRAAGAAEGAALADTLAAWLEDAGLAPALDGAWIQEFALEGTGWAGQPLSGRTGRNLAGVLRGDGALAGRWIVLAAHHDHLGRVEAASAGAPAPAPGQYYPGANDNASGVAIVREVARLLASAAADTPRRSLLVVLFDGEEVGLQGASHFIDHLPVPETDIDVMVNLDTVGRLHDATLHVSGVGTSPPLPDLVAAADAQAFTLSLGRGGWSGSDHMVFNTREVPVLFLFGGPYPEYNRPTDTAATLDPEAMAEVAAFAVRLVAGLRAAPGPFPWVMVGEKHLRPDDDAATDANRDTWFGSLPDFTEGVAGYKLAGVFDESPAARAGLQKGDVLVRFGGDEVVDLAGFTGALRARDPGDLVEVEVLREGGLLRFTVVLGNRADRR